MTDRLVLKPRLFKIYNSLPWVPSHFKACFKWGLRCGSGKKLNKIFWAKFFFVWFLPTVSFVWNIKLFLLNDLKNFFLRSMIKKLINLKGYPSLPHTRHFNTSLPHDTSTRGPTLFTSRIPHVIGLCWTDVMNAYPYERGLLFLLWKIIIFLAFVVKSLLK